MTKFIIGTQIAFWLGFILGDAFTGIEFQAVFFVGWIIARLVPGKVWIAIGRGLIEMAPWVCLANLDL